MRAAVRLYCLLALLGIAFACQSYEPESMGTLKEPIHYGTEDFEHEAVCYIGCEVSNGFGFVQRHAHRAQDGAHGGALLHLQESRRPKSCAVAFGLAEPFDEVIGAVAIHRHPGYVSDWHRGLPKDDMAILRLEHAPEGVEPIPALPARMGGMLQQGVHVEIVGYGTTESGGYGTRLHTTVPVLDVCSDDAGCRGNSPSELGLAPHTFSYDCTASSTDHGDSGGAALLLVEGTEYVVGVTSAGILNLIGVSAKVDEYEAFLSKKFGGDKCESASECETGICSQGVCCETECDGVCRACSRAAGAKKDGVCGPATDVPCDDGDPCTVNNVCMIGVCTGAPKCASSEICKAGTCESRGCSSAGGAMPLWLAAAALVGALRARAARGA